jgi:hypothetical protein
MSTLVAIDSNTSPARPPATMPMIVVSGSELDFEDDDVVPEPVPEVAAGAALNTLVEVETVPSEAVKVACTVAGSGPEGYPFSAQYRA